MAVRTKGFQGSHIISFTDKSCPHCVEATEALDGLEAKLKAQATELAGAGAGQPAAAPPGR